MKHPNTIFLIGFSGSGKSSVGRQLAENLKISFFDTDNLVVREAGKSITEIFRDEGEARFRKLEQQAIRKVIGSPGKKVIALGGGAFKQKENRAMIGRAGTVVYLACAQAELYRRIRGMTDRPLLHRATDSAEDLKLRIKGLLAERIKHYNQADIRFSTTGKTVKTAARQLENKLAKLHA